MEVRARGSDDDVLATAARARRDVACEGDKDKQEQVTPGRSRSSKHS